MRILRITVHNIASLEGTHSVDFTRDPLRSAGLFAISGATGAGKSSLLDALCLALFDATPRLHQVGRLAELTDGERQSDPRMLLRRGAGEGFAEVAFVGVDQREWTARWHVWRSRKRADGSLQQVEMTLFRGHIPPGGQGTHEVSGKKTEVRETIVEKVGLRFDQFTRAVLLAQNDFARFLTADDKQRAEILQALTGTERFEAISQAVYQRCDEERRAIDSVEAKLEGNQPLTDDARAEAEASQRETADTVARLETELKQRQEVTKWFAELRKLTGDLAKANDDLRLATETRDASAERRAELELTEIVSRDARRLRDNERNAEREALAATDALAEVEKKLTAHTEAAATTAGKLDEAIRKRDELRQRQQAAEPLLKRARDLDTTLKLRRERLADATKALGAATKAVTESARKLERETSRRRQCVKQQRKRELDRDKLADYVPFAKESGKWLHRIDDAIEAKTAAEKAHEQADSSREKLTTLERELNQHRDAARELQQLSESAARDLNEALAVESAFDADQLGDERSRLDDAHNVLTRLQQQLHVVQKARDETESLRTEIESLQSKQASELLELARLCEHNIPAAVADVANGKSALEFLQAAIADSAKELRTSLREDQPCPVCGSLDHPYDHDEPDHETTAVDAAARKLAELEQERDIRQRSFDRLELATASRSEQLNDKLARRTQLVEDAQHVEFTAADHPDVAAVLAMEEAERQAAVMQRLEQVNATRETHAATERALREAVKHTSSCRKAADAANEDLAKLQGDLTALDKSFGVAESEFAAATNASQQADNRLRDAMNSLAELWNGVPDARNRFDADSPAFRERFEVSTAECGAIQTELSDLAAEIQKTDAAIGPLEESLAKANETHSACEDEQESATDEHEELVNQRKQLFDGRPADDVERELTDELKNAAEDVEEMSDAKHETEKLLAATREARETASRSKNQKAVSRQTARDEMRAWLTSFTERTSRSLSPEELEAALLRDEAWINGERRHLKDLDEAVKSAEGACKVRSEQLVEHQKNRSTDEEEHVVLAAVEDLQRDLLAAKANAETSRAVVLGDDQRRGQNAALANDLNAKRAAAEPWLKLNELIGSADGAKFRMIAQRRTLDVLLSNANHQLSQLAARYRLERLPESLNLVVIDCDMGDERRSIHSLSGGESFLVSLALALGLASLASNRLRIESLFIDEGFGSLDPDTLNTAMNALMHLEAQGRKVGVISHVREMTDAIPVKINVVKCRGGASKVVVPGAAPQISSPSFVDSPVIRLPNEASVSPAELATRILQILQREQCGGKDKVSTTVLRKEIGCSLAQLKAAQRHLGDRIATEGRSLRLA